jgi:hypothetical protein
VSERRQRVDPKGRIVAVFGVELRMQRFPVPLDETADHGEPVGQPAEPVHLDEGAGQSGGDAKVFARGEERAGLVDDRPPLGRLRGNDQPADLTFGLSERSPLQIRVLRRVLQIGTARRLRSCRLQ